MAALFPFQKYRKKGRRFHVNIQEKIQHYHSAGKGVQAAGTGKKRSIRKTGSPVGIPERLRGIDCQCPQIKKTL